MATPEVKAKPTIPETTTTYGLMKDGFMPMGWIPAFRVLTVKTDGKGKANVEASSHKYVLAEAQAIVEDKLKESIGL
jgi:hypothetical protein